MSFRFQRVKKETRSLAAGSAADKNAGVRPARSQRRSVRRQERFRGFAVPQVKKSDKRSAILAAAFDLFSRRGYGATTMADIARAANTTVANLYVYFPSKLVILYEVYNPWLANQI